ncbi:hypothetical protein A8H32_12580 [Burkholderia thailandensis]|nr:hypothetical protein A8H32_12580 [Burkholderia thailandensis]TGB30784.1 hypothetical protein C6946_26675 [Burkholderia thailandensis]
MLAVGQRYPSPGRGPLFFVLPRKSNQKKGASLGGQQRELRFLFPPASSPDSRQTTMCRCTTRPARCVPVDRKACK